MAIKKLLFIGYVWPEPTTTAAGSRMLQLITAFRDKDYDIHFATTAVKTSYSFDLATIGIQEHEILLNDSSFDVFIKTLLPEIVVFDRFMVEEQFGWRVTEQRPEAIRILNTEDLHSLRASRGEAVKENKVFEIQQWLDHPATVREMASIYRSDVSLIISSFEIELLKKQKVASERLQYLPLLPNNKEDNNTIRKGFSERTGFICVGNGKHAPNTDAICYLKEHIWPLIRKSLPNAQVKIYGAYLPARVTDLHSPKEGFLIQGWIENLNKAFTEARVHLAPLRFGAGVKGKLIDAMQYGTPSVTTTGGAEGLFSINDAPGVVCDIPQEIAAKAIKLYSDSNQWHAAVDNGNRLLNTKYNSKQIWDSFFQQLDATIQNLDTHRRENIIGRMLHQQALSSTKYMAKWIEEKNKKKD